MSPTVLLIDDSKFMRRANELAFARAGYTVLVAGDGEEGLQVARNKVPDVIVLDMMLPKISGPKLLDLLKKDVKTAQIPVVVLSSLPQSNEGKLKEHGAAAYFEKAKLGLDNGPSMLLETIQGMLAHSAKGA